MVIRYTNLATGVVAHTNTGATRYFPADRCTYNISQVENGYEISNVFFYPGAGTSVDGIELVSGTSTSGEVTLGYIGKSGRFVAMSNL